MLVKSIDCYCKVDNYFGKGLNVRQDFCEYFRTTTKREIYFDFYGNQSETRFENRPHISL